MHTTSPDSVVRADSEREVPSAIDPYDGVLLLSFGGPEGPDDVMPFLRRVTAGRGIPDERLAEVAEHYYHFGGRSPINDQSRALMTALTAELRSRGIEVPVVWGNRNFHPLLADALRAAHERGMRRLVAVFTSAYSSYSSCRQYREDLAGAIGVLDGEGRRLRVDKVRPYYNHPGFAQANVRLVADAVRRLRRGESGRRVALAFVTHSVPTAMDDTSGPADPGVAGRDAAHRRAGSGLSYQGQHQLLADAIAAQVRQVVADDLPHRLVYCSRSGPPAQPWLEPDINDYLTDVASQDVDHVVCAPIGFVSDHMEVRYDLDTEAAATAARLGLGFTRVPTVGTDPQFVAGLADLLCERAAQARGERVSPPVWPESAALPSTCLPGCCRNLRHHVPALCGTDSKDRSWT